MDNAEMMKGKEMITRYNANRVIISFFVSFLGAYMCTSLCEQLRASYILGIASVWKDIKWFLLMGISLGGIGIWSMHFIGMSSLSLFNPVTHKEINMSYNLAVSVASLIVVIITTTVGVMVSANDPMFMKTKGEILEMFVQDTSRLSMAEVRKMKNSRLFWLITTKNLSYLVIGGVIAGSGVSIMHFIGMEAMQFHGRIHWHAGLVAGAVLIAIIASIVAFWILFRLLSLFPSKEFLRIISSLIMGIAVCGMHYTGMVAADFSHNDKLRPMVESAMMHESDGFIPVVVAVVSMLVLITIVLLSDLRGIVHKYNVQVKRATNPNWKASNSNDEHSSTIGRFFRLNGLKVYPSMRSLSTTLRTGKDATNRTQNSVFSVASLIDSGHRRTVQVLAANTNTSTASTALGKYENKYIEDQDEESSLHD